MRAAHEHRWGSVPRRAGPARQRGVALIIALILVALATILATKLTFDGWLERRRTLSVLAAEQSVQFSLGAEALAATAFADIPDSLSISLEQPWAQPTQPLPITPENNPEGEPIGTVQGSLEDLQGRFNLNNLGHAKQTPASGAGNAAGRSAAAEALASGAPPQLDEFPLLQFQRLLVSVGLEPKWAGIARDWITATDQASSPDGAKDSVYTSQVPPYRTGLWPMMSASELLNMPGFGADRYRLIAPYVTALPTATAKINLCTAPAKVLESLAANMGSDFTAELLTNSRKSGCFPDSQTFGNVIRGTDPTNAPDIIANRIQQTSRYFRLTTHVTLGTTDFTLYSLLYRSNGKVATLQRTFGTP